MKKVGIFWQYKLKSNNKFKLLFTYVLREKFWSRDTKSTESTRKSRRSVISMTECGSSSPCYAKTLEHHHGYWVYLTRSKDSRKPQKFLRWSNLNGCCPWSPTSKRPREILPNSMKRISPIYRIPSWGTRFPQTRWESWLYLRTSYSNRQNCSPITRETGWKVIRTFWVIF